MKKSVAGSARAGAGRVSGGKGKVKSRGTKASKAMGRGTMTVGHSYSKT